MNIVVITPPAAEPLSLADAKEHLRVLHTSEDTAIAALIAAARAHLELTLGRALMLQTLEGYLPAFPACGRITLPRPPLLSVTSIKYLDTDGAEQTLGTDQYTSEPAAFYGLIERSADGVWPPTATNPRAVRIRWQAGYAAAEDVPAGLGHALKLLVGHWYYNREAVGQNAQALPFAVEALTAPHRTHGWI